MRSYAFIIMVSLISLTCTPDQSTGITYDKKRIQDLFLYDRDLRPQRLDIYRHIIKDHRDISPPSDSIFFKPLNLKAYVFKTGNPEMGPIDQCLCFCWKTKTVQQVAFIYKGEYEMASLYGEPIRKSGTDVSLGQQLTQFAMEFGPKLSRDKNALKVFVQTVMTELLDCPELTKEILDKSLSNPNARDHFNNLKSGKNNLLCQKQLRLIQKQMAKNDQDLLFFQGELANGIWQAEIVPGFDDNYKIKLDYLNGECTYVLWF